MLLPKRCCLAKSMVILVDGLRCGRVVLKPDISYKTHQRSIVSMNVKNELHRLLVKIYNPRF